MRSASSGKSSRCGGRCVPVLRLLRISGHLRTGSCSSSSEGEDPGEAAFRRYCEEGEAKAVALGNRGPIRFDEEGKLAPEILEAYQKHGFYVFEGLLSDEEVRDLRSEYESTLDNAPVAKGSKVDRHGRPVQRPGIWSFVEPLRDDMFRGKIGVFNFNGGESKPRHQMLMREPAPPPGAPEHVIQNILYPLGHMDAPLRAYGHPALLKIAEAVNGPNFTPFTEIFWIKPAGTGSSTSWHQDPSSAWDEAWSQPGFDYQACGLSFHISLYNSTAANTLWIVPGSHRLGRVDIPNFPREGADMLKGAVPCIAKPGDVYLQNRLALHGAFANTSPEQRVTLALGFHKRSSVLGKKTIGYARGMMGGKRYDSSKMVAPVYDEAWIRERSRMIMWAIAARRQKYPEETPYSYQPFRGQEDEYRWHEGLKEDLYAGKYWETHLII